VVLAAWGRVAERLAEIACDDCDFEPLSSTLQSGSAPATLRKFSANSPIRQRFVALPRRSPTLGTVWGQRMRTQERKRWTTAATEVTSLAVFAGQTTTAVLGVKGSQVQILSARPERGRLRR
jgi:hypothetical protein